MKYHYKEVCVSFVFWEGFFPKTMISHFSSTYSVVAEVVNVVSPFFVVLFLVKIYCLFLGSSVVGQSVNLTNRGGRRHNRLKRAHPNEVLVR